MSGHSKWATTHRQKSAADAKKGAVFTKIANLIIMAAKQGGGDPEANFTLRLAIDKAKAVNMPKDNIERAVKRGTGEGGEGKSFEEITYEIFGPAGSVFIAESITDNKNRTVSDLKAILNRNGGQLGALNSVSWMFERKGVISIDAVALAGKDTDELELSLIDAGADDIAKEDSSWEIQTAPDKLNAVIMTLKDNGLEAKESGLQYLAQNDLVIKNPEDQSRVENFYNLLDDMDDINAVYTNASW